MLSQAVTDKQVYASFQKSTEFESVNQPTELMYEVYLGRAADGAGLSSWLQAQRSGKSMDEIASAFARSAEFQALHGNVLAQGPAEFVTFLYQTVLQRTPTQSELNAWTAQLATGTQSRGNLLAEFLHVPEFQATHSGMTREITVDHAYQAFLGRSPD